MLQFLQLEKHMNDQPWLRILLLHGLALAYPHMFIQTLAD